MLESTHVAVRIAAGNELAPQMNGAELYRKMDAHFLAASSASISGPPDR